MDEKLIAEEQVAVDTRYELTEEIAQLLRENVNGKLKKIVIDGQTYVFKPLTHKEWDSYIVKWVQERMRVTKAEVSLEERQQRLIDVAVVFPSEPLTFENNRAIKIVFWNNVPAGVPHRLSQLIQHHSGWLIPGMYSQSDIVVEDIGEDEPIDPRPEEDFLNNLVTTTDMPCKLLRVNSTWWVIRGMSYAEAKTLKKFLLQDPDSNYELSVLKSCILMGPTNFNEMPAGVVSILINFMNEASGLSKDGVPEEILDIEADDL